MQRVRRPLPVVEPAALQQRIAQGEYVELQARRGISRHGDQVILAIPEHLEAVDGTDAGAHLIGVCQGDPRQLQIALEPQMLNHRPGGGHGQTGPGALQVG
jgi:hypothetical protein